MSDTKLVLTIGGNQVSSSANALTKLYSFLHVHVVKSQTTIDINQMCSTLNTLNIDHAEIIMLLIYHHYALENKGQSYQKVPYSGIIFTGGKGVLYQVRNLPPVLQHILEAYLRSYDCEALRTAMN